MHYIKLAFSRGKIMSNSNNIELPGGWVYSIGFAGLLIGAMIGFFLRPSIPLTGGPTSIDNGRLLCTHHNRMPR